MNSSWRIRKDRFSGYLMCIIALCIVAFVVAMGTGLYMRSRPILAQYSAWELLSGTEWKPSQNKFGFLPYVMGTLSVTALAVAIALPLSFLTATFLTEYSRRRVKRLVYPALDILASLPSVIYGVWGTLIVVPFISRHLAPHFVEYSSGYTVLAAGVVLCVMITPMMVSLFVEIMSAVPMGLREASLALGATRWQTTKKVIVRQSLPGLFAAVILAVSKALGETIAVLMVCGNLPKIPSSLFDACYPIPALLANNYGEMLSVPMYESALMFSALALFVVIVLFNVISRIILNRINAQR